MSRRLRRTSEQVESLSFEPAMARLIATIFKLAEVQSTAGTSRPWIVITQKELGQMIGLSRESTNRFLREWEQAGLIKLEKGGCRILNRAALLTMR